jgi:hypothetical protein
MKTTLTSEEIQQSTESITSCQQSSGLILRHTDGLGDPWNHVEAAMALTLGGRNTEAVRAYQWLIDTQLSNGCWYNFYRADGSIHEDTWDTNFIAYIATGVWHHWLVTQDKNFVLHLWPTIHRSITAVLHMQQPRGEIIWARKPTTSPWKYALLTGCSSIVRSLDCATRIATLLGDDQPKWHHAMLQLADLIENRPEVFTPKKRWSMDWYYPVLAGILTNTSAEKRLHDQWEEFVDPHYGVRCVSDQPWFTAAETAECALAHLAAGSIIQRETAKQLLAHTRQHRQPDGSYLTGIVYPQQVSFPDNERSTYSTAAVLLANDALTNQKNLFLQSLSRSPSP